MCPTLIRTQYHHPLKECRAKSSKNMKENSRNLTASKREFPREWKRYFKIAFQSTRFPMESNFQPLILDLNTTSSNNIPTILFSNFLHRSSKAKYLKNFTILSIIFVQEMHLIRGKRFKKIWSDLAYARLLFFYFVPEVTKLNSIKNNLNSNISRIISYIFVPGSFIPRFSIFPLISLSIDFFLFSTSFLFASLQFPIYEQNTHFHLRFRDINEVSAVAAFFHFRSSKLRVP